MNYLRLVILSFAIFPDLAFAEVPPLPALPTTYEQCDIWYRSAKDYVSDLGLEAHRCIMKITVADTRDQVPLSCGGGTAARVCIAEINDSQCAHGVIRQKLESCRLAVRTFLESRANNNFNAEKSGAVQGDLRNEIIGSYFGNFRDPMNFVDFTGKDFMGKVSILKGTLDTMNKPSPRAVLSTGQEFASAIFSGSGASDLASRLFDASSRGVTEGGVSAVNQAIEALAAFDAKFSATHRRSESEGVLLPRIHVRSQPVVSSGGNRTSSSGVGQSCTNVVVNGRQLYWCLHENGQPYKRGGYSDGTQCNWGRVEACE